MILSKREEKESRLFDKIIEKYSIPRNLWTHFYSLFRLVFSWMRVHYQHLSPSIFLKTSMVLYLRLMKTSLREIEKRETSAPSHDPTFGTEKHRLDEMEKIFDSSAMNQQYHDSIESWKLANEEAICHTQLLFQRMDHTLDEVDIYRPIKQIRILHDLPIVRNHIFIDSRMRNRNTHPDTNKYTIVLNEVLKNVVQIELISVAIPYTQYTIDSTNNQFFFAESVSQTLPTGSWFSCVIPSGIYTASTLATTIKNTMNSVVGSNSTYSTSVSSGPKYTLTITSDGTGGDGLFYLKFESFDNASAHEEMGFEPDTIYSNSLFYTGPNPMNLESDSSIFININDFQTIEGLADYTYSSLASFFTQIPFNTCNCSFGDYIYSPLSSGVLALYIPQRDKIVDTLSKLDITLRNSFGELFDSNGVDHCMTFRITTLTIDSI